MSNLIFKKETHEYFKDNKKLVSVSKILNNYFGNSYKNISKEILKLAANRGNAVHKILELFFKYKDNKNVYDKLLNLIDNNFKGEVKQYCITALNWIIQFYKNKEQLIISEKPLSYDFIAGTPDLLIKNEELNLWIILDFKTLKKMTNDLKAKAELQIVAYYWLALKNGYEMVNIHFIPWFKKDSVELIKIEITEAKLHEWNMAIALYKEDILKDGN